VAGCGPLTSRDIKSQRLGNDQELLCDVVVSFPVEISCEKLKKTAQARGSASRSVRESEASGKDRKKSWMNQTNAREASLIPFVWLTFLSLSIFALAYA